MKSNSLPDMKSNSLPVNLFDEIERQKILKNVFKRDGSNHENMSQTKSIQTGCIVILGCDV